MRTGIPTRSILAVAALATCALGFHSASDGAAPAGEVAADEASVLGTTIVCSGTRCGGTGGPLPRHWSYEVTPGPGGIDRVDIGLHFRMTYWSAVVKPADWTMQILPDLIADDLPFTQHSVVTPQNGPYCVYVVRFSGPTKTAPFQLGYNSHESTAHWPHEVEWDSSDGSVANWASPVGTGAGPVHSPRDGIVPMTPENGAAANDHDHDLAR